VGPALRDPRRRARPGAFAARAGLVLGMALAGCGDARDVLPGPPVQPADDAAALPSDRAPRTAGDGEPAESDSHLRTFIDSIRSAEGRRLAGSDAPVRRSAPGTLVVEPHAAPAVVFQDEIAGGDMLRIHVFRGRLRAGFAILEIIHYEGGEFLLVDERTGATHAVDSMPVVSPDGLRFVTTSLDLVAGHQPNRIAIYRFTADGVVEEWSELPRGWGPSQPEWLDDRTVRFMANVVDLDVQPHALTQSVARVGRAGARWTLRL
jgi:hypothetical protein